jgi:hypothetical protein
MQQDGVRYGEWEGGHVKGRCFVAGRKIIIMMSTRVVHRIKIADYPTADAAMAAAEAFKTAYSHEHDFTINRYRLVTNLATGAQ